MEHLASGAGGGEESECLMGTEFQFETKEMEGGDGCTLRMCLVYFETKAVTRDKEELYIMIRVSIQKEYINCKCLQSTQEYLSTYKYQQR